MQGVIPCFFDSVILSEVSLTTWQLVALVGMIPEWGEGS